MVFLGVDPGSYLTGYAFLKYERGTITVLDFGLIRPPAKLSLVDRSFAIFSSLGVLIKRFDPQHAAFETQFIGKNPQTGLKLGIARGAAMMAARSKTASIREYTPSEVKRAVSSSGRASKEQVQGMMQRLLSLQEIPEENAADALAIAYCDLQHQGRTCTPLFAAN